MAWADKRAGARRYTAYWYDERGVQRQKSGYASKAATEEMARKLEDECRKIRDGLVDPAERSRRDAAGRPLADHLAAYRKALEDRANTATHVKATHSAILRLCKSGDIRVLPDLTGDRVLSGLAAWRAKGRSPRTLNHALVAVKGFAKWLAEAKRIAEVDGALARLPKFPEAADLRRQRRALTAEEVAKLLRAAEQGPPALAAYGPTKSKLHATHITGPERAALYRLAMGTGFRADELRTLTPERFALDGPEPTVTVLACYSKNGKLAVQPITRELAAGLAPFVAGKEPGKPVLNVPTRTAQLLRRDLDAAGIKYQRRGEGVVDFHSLRHSYITHLIRSGANPKIVQALARHSDIKLTLTRYTHLEDGDLRKALEGE